MAEQPQEKKDQQQEKKDQTQEKKEQPPEKKIYFKFLPKEEVFHFLESFKKALTEIPKSDEKKNFEFEIKGTRDELNGIVSETHCIEKGKFKEFFDMAQPHIQKALGICSITFNANDDSSVNILKELFEKMKHLFLEIPFVKKHPENYELHFRNNGNKIFIDVTSVQGEFLKPITELGLDISEYQKLDCYFKTGFCPDDFFNLPIEELSLKVIQFALKLKSESIGLRHIITACIQALKGIKLANEKFQKILEEHIEKLNMLNAFVSFVFSFEFDGKELCGQGLKVASETLLKGKDFNKLLEDTRQKVIAMGQVFIKPILEENKLVDAVKAVNVDEITIILGFPKHENGLIQNIKLPGFSKAFVTKIFG